MTAAGTHQDVPVGVRFTCEECTEETILALPPARTRYGVVDCPFCHTTYLVALNAGDLAGNGDPAGRGPDGRRPNGGGPDPA